MSSSSAEPDDTLTLPDDDVTQRRLIRTGGALVAPSSRYSLQITLWLRKARGRRDSLTKMTVGAGEAIKLQSFCMIKNKRALERLKKRERA